VKAIRTLACCLLAFPLAGPVLLSGPKARTQSAVNPEEAAARLAGCEELSRQATSLFQSGQYQEALRKFETSYRIARSSRLPRTAARALGNVGASQLALHQYRPALDSFLEARRQAEAAGDHSAAAIFDINTASLYSELGELDSAAEWIQGTIHRLGPREQKRLPQILIQLATLRARQDRMDDAVQIFRRGIQAADAAGDLQLYANGWNRLGEEYLKRGELSLAEPPLLEAYRIRKLNRLALDVSYRSLGRLRLEQGDLDSASALLERAVELAIQPKGMIPAWDTYHYRGRLHMAQGRLEDALSDLRTAVALARAWRWSAPPDETSRVGAEGWLELVHSAMVEAGNRLYLKNGNTDLIRESFEAAEENRALSLRVAPNRGRSPDPSTLPPAYWEMLGNLQRAEVQALRARDTASRQGVAQVRAELVRMELALGSATAPPAPALMERVRKALDSETAMLSVQLGDRTSWLWALDREGLALYALPPRAAIEQEIDAANKSIRDASGEEAQALLWRTLFGPIAMRFQQRTRWLVAFDRGSTLADSQVRFATAAPAAELPLAALVDSSRRPAVYLAERHIVEMIPGAGFWLEARERRREPAASLFVGVGDPIYNTADPRLASVLNPAKPGVVLPRLVASSAELDACARAWSGDHVFLKGADATARGLRAQLDRNPAVIHLATHVVESSERPAYGLIALSLTPLRESQLLPPFEIAGWQTHTGLVVLSGCHSAGGPRIPGAGLLGLTRAWLMAGAGAVIASNWETPDQSGALFSALYRNLSGQRNNSPASALRAAQVEMIRSGGWQAKPSYWGAYFVMGSQ